MLNNNLQNLFCIPIFDKYLLYSPQNILTSKPTAALVNRASIKAIKSGNSLPAELSEWMQIGSYHQEAESLIRTGSITSPFFLGLIPTRGCNLSCRYCNFDAPKHESPRMSLTIARSAIDAHIQLLQAARKSLLEVHFFGGEPFFAWETVFFSVEYARLRAVELGMKTRFEVITNGVFSADRCRWIANHFDTVVLSLDGPPDLHEWQRPATDEKSYFKTVLDNARILSSGPSELALRVCVTQNSVDSLPEIARYFIQAIEPKAVCFEMLVDSPSSQSSGLLPPDPYIFSLKFLSAAQILEEAGIEAVVSTVNLNSYQSSFCPVGKDALIVSPDGTVDGCYLLPEDWQSNGLDLHLGNMSGSQFSFSPGAVQHVRNLTGEYKSPCRDCFCQYHCAGGCHVRRSASPMERRNTEVCIHTRLVTIANILLNLGQAEILDDWLLNQQAIEAAALSCSDRLQHIEEFR